MGAINESIWVGLAKETRSAIDYWQIYRYDIADGDWTLVKEYTGLSIEQHKMAMAWDGGFHVWYILSESVTPLYEYKRITLSDLSVSDQPDIPAIKANYNSLCQDWGGKLYNATYPTSGADARAYGFDTKLWGSLPNPEQPILYGAGCTVVPPWATYQAGNLFVVRTDADNEFYMYDISGGTWATKAYLPLNSAGAGALAWAPGFGAESANEYVYGMISNTRFDRYDVDLNSWAAIAGGTPANKLDKYQGNTLVWDGDQLLYYLSNDSQIRKFDLNTQSWSAFIEMPFTWDKAASLAYSPRIRFIICDSDGTELYAPVALGSVPKGRTSTPVKYYLKAFDAEGGDPKLEIIADDRTDADDVLQLAPDNAGVPGAWTTFVTFAGGFAANESKPFWMRTNTLSTTVQEAKIARLKITVA